MMTFVSVAKLVPVGYGIKKLQIGCVVEDDKVSTFSCGGLKSFYIYGRLETILNPSGATLTSNSELK